MELTGAVDIFNRSNIKCNPVYKKYLGDGDTSSFNDVFISETCVKHTITPMKLECIGHVQNRLGTRLCKVKSYKGTKLLFLKKINLLINALIPCKIIMVDGNMIKPFQSVPPLPTVITGICGEATVTEGLFRRKKIFLNMNKNRIMRKLLN